MCSVRNNGQHSDVVWPFLRFVQSREVWVRHLARHYLNAHLTHTHTHSDATKSFVLRISTYAFIMC